MDNFDEIEEVYLSGLTRCRHLCELQDYLSASYGPALDTSDMLRASVVLCVSSFDFLVHECFRVAVIKSYKSGVAHAKIQFPFEALVETEENKKLEIIDSHIRHSNSFKSFVHPAKFAEALSCFFDRPWDNVSAVCGKESKALKSRLRNVYRWRNRIAHEADVKPVLAGVELWPIEKQDVLEAINDVEEIGTSTIELFRRNVV